MLSGRGYYDAVMMHSFQFGPLLSAGAIRPIDELLKNSKPNPALDTQTSFRVPTSRRRSPGKQYGFINWNYNQVYWARGDLLGDSSEQAAFKAKYGYDLGPAKTMEQMRDIAEFFTRKKGEKLAGKPLENDFYGIVLEGIKGGTTFTSMWENFIKNYGGDIIDNDGKPTFDTPENVAAIKMWAAALEVRAARHRGSSLIDVPTMMGNGIAAQTIAWSDFVLGIDRPGKSPFAGKFVYGPIPTKAGGKLAAPNPSPP